MTRPMSLYESIRTGGIYWLVSDDGATVEILSQRTGVRETLSKADFERQFRQADR